MNSDKLLDAIGMIDDRHFESKKNNRIVPWRRKVVVLIAAVLMLTLMIGTAMAVSPEFREMVFRFIRIEEVQIMPDSTQNTETTQSTDNAESTEESSDHINQTESDDLYVEQNVVIGDVIRGTYIHTPVLTYARNGIFMECTDEVQMRQGSHYDGYYEENGDFYKLNEYSFVQDYVLYDNEIHAEFDWVVHEGSVSLTWAEPNAQFRKDNRSGDASAALFMFNIYWRGEDGKWDGTWYPVILNLYTGELTDILAGTGANRLEGIEKCAISPDRTKILLGQDTKEGYYLYYVDLVTKQLHSIDALSGQKTTACSLADNTLICWNLTDGFYTAWTINLTTMERTELFESKFDAAETPEADAGIVFMEGFDHTNRWGDMYCGSCFALEVDEAQNVYVIDLTTGARSQITGCTWTAAQHVIAGPDGSKLLLAGKHNGSAFEYVGVLDFTNMTFAEFFRDNSLHEHTVYWFNDHTVVICSDMSFDSMCSHYYLYSLIPETE